MSIFFFFNDTATTEIYTLSLHDALPIFMCLGLGCALLAARPFSRALTQPKQFSIERSSPSPRPSPQGRGDRKSTRLNSSHGYISYAVFCLKKKKNNQGERVARATRTPRR